MNKLITPLNCSTTSIVLNFGYCRRPENFKCKLQSIAKYADQDDWFRNCVEIHCLNHLWVILLAGGDESRQLLSKLVYDWLRLICIEEQCRPFDECEFIELLGLISEDERDVNIVKSLRQKVDQHVDHAMKHFEGNIYFHRESNCEFVTNFSLESNTKFN